MAVAHLLVSSWLLAFVSLYQESDSKPGVASVNRTGSQKEELNLESGGGNDTGRDKPDPTLASVSYSI